MIEAAAYAVQARTHYQTYLERPQGADLPPKKVCNLDPMAARSRQKRQERGPSAPVPSIMYENWAGVDIMSHLDGRWRR